jgi:hypothetical protein
MTTTLRLLFLGTCLAILAGPTLNAWIPLFDQAPLQGGVAQVPRPEPALSSLLDEKFQRDFTAYFDQRYGARPTATRIDNSIAYWIFHELPPDKAVRVGTNGVLYLSDHLDYCNRRDRPDAPAFARKYKLAQDLLLARGKVLVLMLVPTKPAVWADDLPREWMSPGAESGTAKRQISDPFVDALTQSGALFVDGRQTATRLPREAVYAKTGRHVSAPAACLILGEALDLARPLLRDLEIPPIDCSYRMASGVDIAEEEFDLFRLLNVWTPRPDVAVPVLDPVPERKPGRQRAKAMILGTSFGWKVMKEAVRTHAVEHAAFHYYFNTFYERYGDRGTVIPLGGPAWVERVEAHSLFLLPTPEEYLVGDGLLFLDHIIALLTGVPVPVEQTAQ